jgi:hypothetical protein
VQRAIEPPAAVRPLTATRKRERPVRAAMLAFAREPVLFFWCVFVATIPIYVGESGMPQPGNALIFLIVPLALARWDNRLDRSPLRALLALLVFTAWVCVVNFTWAAITAKFNTRDYLIFPIYYIFNAAVLLAALLIYRRVGDLFLRATTYSVLVAVGYQVITSFVYSSSLYRDALFFNNPNQLGYWALLAACLIALTQKRLKIGLLVSGIGITGCAYLAILSASRAALAGIAILLILQVFSNPRLIIAGVIAAVGITSVGGPLSGAIDASQRRAELEDQKAAGGFVVERGYDRLWEYKEYLLLGAGEGDLTRFTDQPEKAHEIHSSAATVLFSYGIVGAVLFLMFMWRVVAGASLRYTLILVPTLAYAIAHQGLRFTMLWVLVAIFIAQKPVSRAKAKIPARLLRPT